jgi:DNA-directed RNA polymerase subunit RPC12/RpoP
MPGRHEGRGLPCRRSLPSVRQLRGPYGNKHHAEHAAARHFRKFKAAGGSLGPQPTSRGAREMWLTGCVPRPTMVAVGRTGPTQPRGPAERRRNVCPGSSSSSERSPDLSFPRSFRCGHCGVDVSLDAPGTSHRNHCPRCLWSRHLDRNVPGDRKAECPGAMEPIAVTVRGERRWMLIHRCTHCGRLRMNRTAADDSVLLLLQLAALPLATPLIPAMTEAARQ